jgi:hypothetical protein
MIYNFSTGSDLHLNPSNSGPDVNPSQILNLTPNSYLDPNAKHNSNPALTPSSSPAVTSLQMPTSFLNPAETFESFPDEWYVMRSGEKWRGSVMYIRFRTLLLV